MGEILYKARLVFSVLMLIAFVALTVCFLFGIINISAVVAAFKADLARNLIITFAVLFGVTFLFGRIFCSMFCPCGILQEIVSGFADNDFEKRKNQPAKYIIAVVLFALLYFAFAKSVHFAMLPMVVAGVVLSIAVLVLSYFKGRLFCTSVCPIGTVLGLIAKFSPLKMSMNKDECLSCGMCERNCQASCLDSCEQEIDNENCLKCFKCMSYCSRDAIGYSFKLVPELKIFKK